MLGSGPFQGDGISGDIDGPETGGLTGDPVLGLDLDRHRERTRTDAGDGLDADRVDGQRHQIADRRQQIVVDDLRVPRRDRLSTVRRVKHFVRL